MKNISYRISSVLIICVFMFMAYGSGESDDSSQSKIEIYDINAIESFIVGKWSHEYFDTYYRYMITDTEIKCWTKYANNDWNTKPDDTWTYTISEMKKTNRGDDYRDILIDGEAGKFQYTNSIFIDNCLEHFGQCMTKGWD